MPILRLAYATQFLIALIAVFVLWSQVGGQSHLDLMPWHFKLALGVCTALASVKATEAAVGGDRAWNGRSLKWFGLTLALLLGCGLASYYCHLNYEDGDEGDQQPTPAISSYRSEGFQSARRLARSAPTSATSLLT
jgi:hypothetical protein